MDDVVYVYKYHITLDYALPRTPHLTCVCVPACHKGLDRHVASSGAEAAIVIRR